MLEGVEVGPDAARVDVVLPLAGKLRIDVIDAAGRPALGAHVAIVDARGASLAFGDGDGLLFGDDLSCGVSATITLPALARGRYRVAASRGPLWTGVREVEVRAGEETRTVLQLGP